MRTDTMVEGMVGGTIGAIAVAVWFLLIDVSTGQALRTPALLGATLFEGLRDPGTVHIGSSRLRVHPIPLDRLPGLRSDGRWSTRRE